MKRLLSVAVALWSAAYMLNSSPVLAGSDLIDIAVSNNWDWDYDINSYVYFRQSSGAAYQYSASDWSKTAQTLNHGAEGVAAADIDQDGNLDLVIASYKDNSETTIVNSYIYWGGGVQPYSTHCTDTLKNSGAYGVSVADVDKDGLYDIIFSNTYDSVADKHVINSRIYFGQSTDRGQTMYSEASMKLLPTSAAQGNCVADLDKDGNLDIVFANYVDDDGIQDINSYVYWGDGTKTGFTTKAELPTCAANDVSVADLNNDGYLDIVFANQLDNSYVYWGDGTRNGFTKTELPTIGFSPMSNAVADLNSDGFQDIVFANYIGGKSYVFWGDLDGDFSSKTELVTANACGTAIGDLNADGYLDIVFSAHSNSGNLYVYYGDQDHNFSLTNYGETYNAVGVSTMESNIWAGNTAFGSVVPLWATAGGYGTDIITSWQYDLIDTKGAVLNSGALDFSAEEVAKLTKLYFDGKAGGSPSPVTIDGITWNYFNDPIGGKSAGDAWYDGSYYYFYMGSGIKGEAGGADVPEPSTLLLILLPFLGFGWRMKKRAK